MVKMGVNSTLLERNKSRQPGTRKTTKVGLVTTSVSALPDEIVRRYGIKIVPLPFILDGHKYLDGVDISASRVYELLAYEKPFRTTAPSPGDYLNTFMELGAETGEILCLTVSKKLSMMYESASDAARNMPKDVTVAVVDTGTAAGAQALIDIAVAHAIESGASLKEAVELVNRLRQKAGLFGCIMTPKYLARTGRVPALLPRVASAIKIQPIISIRDGATRIVKVVRTVKAGILQMLVMTKDEIGNRPARVIIQHASYPEGAEFLKEQVEHNLNCTELFVTEFSPVMGYATGPGTLVLSFITDQ